MVKRPPLPCPLLQRRRGRGFLRHGLKRVQNNYAETKGIVFMPQPLTADLLRKMHSYWRAANYLSVGQIYLYENPLLKRPLKIEDVKPRLLGHWGTTPGLNFI